LIVPALASNDIDCAMGGNVTVDPRERATPIDDPAIVEARSLRTGRLLDAICGRKGASSI
jgi:hypothetical protein